MSGFPFYILILLVNILQSPLNLSPSLGLSTPITNFRKEEFDHSVGSPDVFVQWRTLKVVICSVLGVGGGGPGYSQLSDGGYSGGGGSGNIFYSTFSLTSGSFLSLSLANKVRGR